MVSAWDETDEVRVPFSFERWTFSIVRSLNLASIRISAYVSNLILFADAIHHCFEATKKTVHSCLSSTRLQIGNSDHVAMNITNTRPVFVESGLYASRESHRINEDLDERGCSLGVLHSYSRTPMNCLFNADPALLFHYHPPSHSLHYHHWALAHIWSHTTHSYSFTHLKSWSGISPLP